MKGEEQIYNHPTMIFRHAETADEKFRVLADRYVDAFAWRNEESEQLAQFRRDLDAYGAKLEELRAENEQLKATLGREISAYMLFIARNAYLRRMLDELIEREQQRNE